MCTVAMCVYEPPDILVYFLAGEKEEKSKWIHFQSPFRESNQFVKREKELAFFCLYV